jgi:uncharacterized protein (DUF924 family)
VENPDTILDFWFGAYDSVVATAAARSKLWWGKDAAMDRAIRERYEPTLKLAAEGRLDAWSDTPAGCLALILLYDQFPRSMYRNLPAAFAYDAAALARCRRGLERKLDRALGALSRVFFYLPLEHSERLPDQERSVMLFEILARDAAAQERKLFADYLRYARRHHEIIARFARFPHRNGILGRPSTPEEEAFLSQPGSSF